MRPAVYPCFRTCLSWKKSYTLFFLLLLLWICFASVHGASVPLRETEGPTSSVIPETLRKRGPLSILLDFLKWRPSLPVARWRCIHRTAGTAPPEYPEVQTQVLSHCLLHENIGDMPSPPAVSPRPCQCSWLLQWSAFVTRHELWSTRFPIFLIVHHPTPLHLSQRKCQSHGPPAFQPDRRQVIANTPWQTLPLPQTKEMQKNLAVFAKPRHSRARQERVYPVYEYVLFSIVNTLQKYTMNKYHDHDQTVVFHVVSGLSFKGEWKCL